MNGKKVLDSYALLAYLNKEKGYDKVKSLLSSEKAVLLMNDINIGEAFYVISRNRGFEKAEYFVNTILKSLPLSTVGNTFHEVLEAARIKAQHALSYADCFVVATALREQATVITGDPEFKKVQSLVQVDWIA